MSIGFIKNTTGKSKTHLFEQDEAILKENGLVLAYLEIRLFRQKTSIQQKISIYFWQLFEALLMPCVMICNHNSGFNLVSLSTTLH